MTTSDKRGDKRKAARRLFRTAVEFQVEADLLQATSVNLSATGVRLDTNRPMEVTLRMPVDGKLLERRARLVWSRKKPNGGMTYGLEFVKQPPVAEAPTPAAPPPAPATDEE